MKLVDVLGRVQWGTIHFGGIVTNKHLPRRDVVKAVGMGLVKSVGIVALCDDDGFTIVPERYREGFALTEAGEEKLKQLEEGQP